MKTRPPSLQSRDIVLVHSSDVHVDARALPGTAAQDGADRLAAVFESARRIGADVILLAGDTFDSHRQPQELIEQVAAIIAAAAAPVIILPGNHDPIVPGSVYQRMSAPIANLHVLGLTHDESVIFPRLDLEVWGRPHRDYTDMIPLEHVRERRTRWQVAMAHGHYQPQPDRSTRLRPSWLIGDEELAATQCDYVALGHWNRAASVGDGRVRAHYSGSPDYEESVNVVRLASDGQVHVSATRVTGPSQS